MNLDPVLPVRIRFAVATGSRIGFPAFTVGPAAWRQKRRCAPA